MQNKNILNATAFLLVIFVFIAGCKSAEKEPVTEPAEEDFDSGSLAVESSPSLANVYIGEEYRGDTPLDLYNLPVGQYDVTIKKKGYADFKKTITIKVGRTEEIDVALTPLSQKTVEAVEEKKPVSAIEEIQNVSAPALNKINLSAFAMYYDFDKMEFTELRIVGSDVFSRKYDTYVYFTAFTPAKISVIDKQVRDIQKEDCIFSDIGVATLFSGQTLCVKTIEGSVAAIGGSWQTTPTELEWIMFG